VTQSFASEPSSSPQNIETLLAAYQTLLDRHLKLVSPEDVNVAVGILARMAELKRLKGAEHGLDTVFANLDRRPDQAGVGGYLKAMLYIRPMNDERRDEKPILLKKVLEALIEAQESGNRLYQRRSTAILASLYFAERDFTNARDAYRLYVQRHPDSPWSWVAALRLGQSLDQLGDARAAVEVYRDVAVAHAKHAVARTFGRAYAARSLESLSRFDEALVELERALQGWDPEFGPIYSLSMGFPGIPPALMMDDLRKEQLQLRVAQLQGSLNAANGRLLERGRWLLDHGRPTEALLPLEEMLQSSRDPRTAAEARELIHRARLRRALDWVAAVPNPDVPAAHAELDLIVRDGPDAVTLAAKVAKASILWRQNAASDAETLMQEALDEWQSHQSPIAGPVTPIGRDVTAIRNLLFQFDDEPIYGRWAGSRNGRRSSTAPFIVVNPDVRVRLVDGTERVYSISQGLAVKERVLFLPRSALSLLRAIHMRLEGENFVAPSRVRQFWSRFFPVGVSMGATLVLESDPHIRDIEFLDAGRTRAAARVAIGHEGTTVILERDDAGIWKAVRLTSTWIA
jgi:tetratricopeptide (TPR) repeat protein